jgi:hypothetical protein
MVGCHIPYIYESVKLDESVQKCNNFYGVKITPSIKEGVQVVSEVVLGMSCLVTSGSNHSQLISVQ